MRKTLVFATATVILYASPAWALRFMGAPTTSGRSGLGIGFDWSHTDFDVRLKDAGTAKLESDVYFARLLLGVTDWAEISGMIGMSDLRDDRTDGDFHSSDDVTWGIGSKLRFWQSGPLQIGAAFQATTLQGDDDVDVSGVTVDAKYDDAYIFELTVGPTYSVTPKVKVYGGPIVHFISGDLEEKSLGIKTRTDVDAEDSEFGGYFGASVELVENTTISAEYHFTDDSYAIGVGIVHLFGPKSKPVPKSRQYSGRPWPRLRKAPAKPVQKEKFLRDEAGNIIKDEDGNFIFVPVEDDS